MTDDEPLCICQHSADQHHETLAYCEAKGCTCVVYRDAEDGFDEDEEPGGIEPLNFDEDGT